MKTTKTLEKFIDWANERGIDKMLPSRNGYTANTVEELGEWQKAWDDKDTHEMIDALADIVVFSCTELVKLGYNPDKVLQETYKEINSRIGSWNTADDKWKKDTSPEAKAKWYKANYENCKL